MEREKDNINTFDNMLVISALREKKKEERSLESGRQGDLLGMCVILNKVVREGLSENVIFESRLKIGEGLNHEPPRDKASLAK